MNQVRAEFHDIFGEEWKVPRPDSSAFRAEAAQRDIDEAERRGQQRYRQHGSQPRGPIWLHEPW